MLFLSDSDSAEMLRSAILDPRTTCLLSLPSQWASEAFKELFFVGAENSLKSGTLPKIMHMNKGYKIIDAMIELPKSMVNLFMVRIESR